jgi:hypothetical protein
MLAGCWYGRVGDSISAQGQAELQASITATVSSCITTTATAIKAVKLTKSFHDTGSYRSLSVFVDATKTRQERVIGHRSDPWKSCEDADLLVSQRLRFFGRSNSWPMLDNLKLLCRGRQ